MKDSGNDAPQRAPDGSSPDHSWVEVAVFPLTRVTLFPRTTKPLNIFEPRYIKMVEDALATGGLIALAYSEPSSQKVQAIGVQGRLRSVAGVGKVTLIEKRPDKTMLILLEAVGKAHLEKVVEGEAPYLKAKARWLKENTTLSNENVFMLHRLMKDLGRWMSAHVQDAEARSQFMAKLQTAEERINAICSLMVLDSDLQQTLLEAESIDERCTQLAMAIESEGTFQ